MDATYTFICQKCLYEIPVKGSALRAHEVAICSACGLVFNTASGKAYAALIELPTPAKRESKGCPQCNERDIREWSEQSPCPKCGDAMRLKGITAGCAFDIVNNNMKRPKKHSKAQGKPS